MRSMEVGCDTLALRKARGAFFTPPAIADYLAKWAVRDDATACVLDPTCGEAVFLLAAARRMRQLGASTDTLKSQVFGVDLHLESLEASRGLLKAEGLDAHLILSDFFAVPTPTQLGCPLPQMDAVIGNPPFVRYQEHTGQARRRSAAAALAQGVRLSGLASSWAALLVYACAFLKPEGRLAMVLPAELLTVHYAAPIRRWLKGRFQRVHLVMFERLQFAEALENVVLVLARGSGGCDAFGLEEVHDASNLANIWPCDSISVTPAGDDKWTDLWLPTRQRQLFKSVSRQHCVPLNTYGSPELGTVTGANHFFALSETTRRRFALTENQVVPISPPGTRHLRGLSFTTEHWEQLRDAGERVWLLQAAADDGSEGLARYLKHGKTLGVHTAYKCQVRTPWWQPPLATPPDLFFTYMSHRYPRLIMNSAKVGFLNSMHGVRLKSNYEGPAKMSLPLLALNSITMLGAEIYGRSYGGGVLKMEPREAGVLPVPAPFHLERAWELLKNDIQSLNRQLEDGRWADVVRRVNDVLLRQTMGLDGVAVTNLSKAAQSLRERRTGKPALSAE